MAQGVLGEGAAPRVLANRARLVRMRQVHVELAAQLAEITVSYDLLADLEQIVQIVLQIYHLTGTRGGQLEGARVDADDVVHGMVMIERQGRGRVHEEFLVAEDRRACDGADHGILRRGPAAAPEPQRVVAQRSDEALAIRIAAADERDL